MLIAKVMEVSAESPRGFEDAIHRGIRTASEMPQSIRGAEVREQQTLGKGRDVAKHRLDPKVAFVLNETQGLTV